MRSTVTSDAHYLVGIDLGTTHTVVAYAELQQGGEQTPARLLQIDQLVGPGEVARKPLLPSFRYHPLAGELADSDLVLPWPQRPLAGELPQVVIGAWARELGSKVDGRLVSSAKSWLSHDQVDRNAAILPWGADDEVAKVSPLLASASYLHHVVCAWDHQFPGAPLSAQQVVITVPASFDEGARALTVEAAALAGLTEILLLEEPQAVCYDWYDRHQQTADEMLAAMKLMMVCDVGGGTTDLSLIRAEMVDGQLQLDRIGVGDHLMLGGDNVDLALAHTAEQRLLQAGKRLNAGGLSQLIQQTRLAKERLLADNAPDSAKVTVLGSGARLIGGAKSCELSREEVHAVALDGFFPLVDSSARPEQRRSAMVAFGLPYASDPAISKHLAAFIGQHQPGCRAALGMTDDETGTAIPAGLLLNGGVFNSPVLAERAIAQLSQWRDEPVVALDNQQPDLAVALGAVVYARARRGSQLKIGGGSARSFFLGLEDEQGQARGICLLPKGTEEETEILLDAHEFALRVGEPVRFNLWSTTEDRAFEAGQLVSLADTPLMELPPLMAALETSPDGKPRVRVRLAARLSEVGTLHIDCVSVEESGQRWSLEFQIRRAMADGSSSGDGAESEQLPAAMDEAIELLEQVYGQSQKTTDPKRVKLLRQSLEKCLGGRDSWSPPLLRALFDQLLTAGKRRRRSEQHEKNWLKLAGFAMRPGFGYALDEWRIEQAWPLYASGLQFNQTSAAWSDWWTFWRRLAGGLDPQQQLTLYRDISRYIDPAKSKNRKIVAELAIRSYEDMVRLAASLEHLPVATKVELVEWLLKRTKKSANAQANWWAIGRIATRMALYGSNHLVIPAEQVTAWLPQLLKADWKKEPHVAFAAVMMARLSGDRNRDLSSASQQEILAKLKQSKAPASWLAMVSEVTVLDEAQTKRIYGDALPSGLKLLSSAD